MVASIRKICETKKNDILIILLKNGCDVKRQKYATKWKFFARFTAQI